MGTVRRLALSGSVMNVWLPAVRTFIIDAWWAKPGPIKAADSDAVLRSDPELAEYFNERSNPGGHWSKRWTDWEDTNSSPDFEFAYLFAGLARRQITRYGPWHYEVTDPVQCPRSAPPLERAASLLVTSRGRVLSKEDQDEIEDVGMREAERWLRSEGFVDIVDTSRIAPWDLEGRTDSRTLYVEAKATQGSWSDALEVGVTRGEVLHAQTPANDCALVVVTDVVLSYNEDGEPSASPGETRVVHPWSPLDDNLIAVAYRHRVPAASAVLLRR